MRVVRVLLPSSDCTITWEEWEKQLFFLSFRDGSGFRVRMGYIDKCLIGIYRYYTRCLWEGPAVSMCAGTSLCDGLVVLRDPALF